MYIIPPDPLQEKFGNSEANEAEGNSFRGLNSFYHRGGKFPHGGMCSQRLHLANGNLVEAQKAVALK